MSKQNNYSRRSELFLVRMWTETTEEGSRLMRGKVQRAVSGEACHFEDWEGLLDRLRAMALQTDEPNAKQQPPDLDDLER